MDRVNKKYSSIFIAIISWKYYSNSKLNGPGGGPTILMCERDLIINNKCAICHKTWDTCK